MSDDLARQLREAIELESARRLAEAKAEIERELGGEFERDMADIARLSSKYKIQVIFPGQARPKFPWAGEVKDPSAFDGTFNGLVNAYLTHEKSPYRGLKHSVRGNYANSFKRMMKNGVGEERIADWNADIIQSRYEAFWAADGKIATGHDMAAKLRLLCTFGSTVLNDDACTRLSAILGNMRFAVSKSTAERLTMDQARVIRATAREHFGWDSIALAQALQVEFPKLRQSDVIGEWVPLNEPGTSDIVHGGQKWLRGLRWSEIDENMMIHRELPMGRGKKPKVVSFNLKRAASVMEEINRIPLARRVGPMVVCEFSALPWSANEFRRKWRKVADKAGVPKSVKNMDSREKAAVDGEQEIEVDEAL